MVMERFKKATNIRCNTEYKGGLDKLPSEAEIFTSETFRYETAKPGDYVVEAVVDEAINCLPPAFLSSACAQMGCPYSHREDPKTPVGGRDLRYFQAMPRCTWHLGILWALLSGRDGGTRPGADLLLKDLCFEIWGDKAMLAPVFMRRK